DCAANGRITDATRALGGQSLVKLCQLQLAHTDSDLAFTTTARREGLCALQAHGNKILSALAAAGLYMALEELLRWARVITNEACADERAHSFALKAMPSRSTNL